MRQPSHGAPSRGFTLVELVVVLVLLGTMLAVVTPAFISAIDRPDATADLVQKLAKARETAIRTASPVDVVIDPVAARIWVSMRLGGARTDTSFLVASPGTRFAATKPRVHFHFRPDGSGWGDSLMITAQGSSANVFIGSVSGAVEWRPTQTVVISP